MKTKATFRIRNWTEYDTSLRQRGSLSFWISQDLLENWTTKEKTGDRGASPTYTAAAIETLAVVKYLFGQASRQAEGLLASIFELMRVSLPVPDHTTLSRRLAKLEVRMPVKPKEQARHVVCDSTGVKVYGEGEWKVRQHGYSKRRTWRKLHLLVDEESREIVSVGASTNAVSDGEMLPELLEAVGGEIVQVSCDGIYDQRKVYDAINRVKARAAIPPRRGARIWQHGNSRAERLVRDENLRSIRKHGRKKWKEEVGYHRRSLAETTVFRYKTIFGDKSRARKIENQFTEMFIKCAALNRMTHLGMPESYKVSA
jgi:Transposase DDE domain